MLEFYTDTYPIARKEHTCSLCGKKIIKGEKYNRYSGKYNGDMFNDKKCLVCCNFVRSYMNETGEREYDEDRIQDYLRDKHCLSCPKNENCETYVLSCSLIRKLYEREKV